jgi:hypothetical protein
MPKIATDATASEYDAAYKAAQPPAVRALMNLQGGANRVQLATQLAEAGYLIDGTIMVWAWDPYWTMKSRLQYGYTWVPSYMQPPVSEAPGITGFPPPYDASVLPAGALQVTLDMDLLPGLFNPRPGTPAALAPGAEITPLAAAQE